MKIEIDSDVCDVINRLKEIDDGYKILLNLKNGKLELHNDKQQNTYCFTLNENEVTPKLLDDVIATSVQFIDDIMLDIDNINNKIEENNKNEIIDYTSYMSKEIYSFSNNSSKEFEPSNVLKSVWR